jgi:hypothetical protein
MPGQTGNQSSLDSGQRGCLLAASFVFADGMRGWNDLSYSDVMTTADPDSFLPQGIGTWVGCTKAALFPRSAALPWRKGVPVGGLFISNKTFDVRFWHKADVEMVPVNVRFRGTRRLGAETLRCRLLTQSGHDRLGVCLRSIQKADRFTFRDSNSLSFCMHWS